MRERKRNLQRKERRTSEKNGEIGIDKDEIREIKKER
jgi:hypothetical protein